ncbi:MAG: RAD55 family ATPase [Planctomycetota bacterium]|jgi:KaiC/GvpD/RAD55 family RecA-like ATPase
MPERLQTGIPRLDDMLNGGLLPGKLTVVVGATGIGKTQLGIQFARRGTQQEGEPGVIFDMTSRGDAQNHADYAERLFDWSLRERPVGENIHPHEFWERSTARYDSMHIFNRAGRRVTISDMEFDDWKAWKVDLAKKINEAIAFFYGNFVHGVRRCVIDGVEPADKPSDSFQFHMFEYVYHQILRKEADWVARDLFRAQFRKNAELVEQHMYPYEDVGCLLLYTCHEMMIDEMIERRIESGDVLSNANTIILMGKYRDGMNMKRALCVAKHRGSAADESIVPYEITDQGINVL